MMSVTLRRFPLTALVACLSFVLSACQGTGERMQEGASHQSGEASLAAEIQARESELEARSVFRVDGGLGIWTDTQSISARLDWQQKADALELILTGPLGMGTLQLLDDGSFVTLRRGETVISQGPIADVVLQKGLGLSAPVPLDELAFWMKGLPGNATTLRRDSTGRLSSLRYTDVQGTQWQARFLRYSDWDGVDVPVLVTASGGPYSVRLRLKNWHHSTTTVVPDRPELNNRLPIPGR